MTKNNLVLLFCLEKRCFYMLDTKIDFLLSDVQSICAEQFKGFALFCWSFDWAQVLKKQMSDEFQIESLIGKDKHGFYYIIPKNTPDDKMLFKMICLGWNYDKDVDFIKWTITLKNSGATKAVYNSLIKCQYDATILPNNMQIVINCLPDSEQQYSMLELQKQLSEAEQSTTQSFDEYLDKILFCGKIENVEYRNLRKQEFQDVQFVEQNKDAIVSGIVRQYFDKKIRAYLLTLVYPNEFDANKLKDKMKRRIMVIKDFLCSVAADYVDTQIKTAVKTKHKPIIRFDYLKSCNEYDGFKQVLRLAKKWQDRDIIRDKILERNINESNKGAYKIMDLEDGYYVVQLFTPKALDYEGDVLDHCLGDGYYDDKIHQKGIEIYSVRNKRGVSLVTLEINNGKVVQCFGYKNKALSDTTLRKIVRTFMHEQNFNIPDINGWNKLIAYIKQDNVLYDVFDLPKNFTTKNYIDLSGMNLGKLPDMSTVTVNGFFCCTTNNLSCLDNAPYMVSGDCRFGNNPLRSLRGMPHYIGGEISLFNTQLNSKSFVPMYIEDKLDNIIGVEDDVIEAWKKQIKQRKEGIQNIIASLSNKERK